MTCIKDAVEILEEAEEILATHDPASRESRAHSKIQDAKREIRGSASKIDKALNGENS